jgi:hypothetical protein
MAAVTCLVAEMELSAVVILAGVVLHRAAVRHQR